MRTQAFYSALPMLLMLSSSAYSDDSKLLKVAADPCARPFVIGSGVGSFPEPLAGCSEAGHQAILDAESNFGVRPANENAGHPPPGAPIPELVMMALPTAEVTAGPPALPPPDPKIGSGHVVPDGNLKGIGPMQLLRGFDDLLGAPPQRNGFLFNGAALDVMGGSYGRIQSLAQVGGQHENYSLFAAVSDLYDRGWQDHSPTRSRQFTGDFGWRRDEDEYHLSVLNVSNENMGYGFQPIELIDRDRSRTVSYPAGVEVKSTRVNFSGDYRLSDGWHANSNLFFGEGRRDTTFTTNSPSNPVACADDASLLCYGSSPLLDTNGQQVPNVLAGTGRSYATLSETATRTNYWGGAFSFLNDNSLFGRPNQFVVGGGYSGGDSVSSAQTTLGLLTEDGGFGTSLGVLATPGAIVPQRVKVRSNYINLYASDIVGVTDRLSVGLSGRWTYSVLDQRDSIDTSPAYNETRKFGHFSPSLGFTFALTPAVIAYAGYYEIARVQTPAGLYCDSPEAACGSGAPWMVADQIQKQDIFQTYQVGLRGQLPDFAIYDNKVQVAWNAGLYRTDESDFQVMNLATGVVTLQDVGKTRRQGVKLGVEVASGPLTTFFDYTYTDARYLSTFDFYSPVNSQADANGNIHVTPGDKMSATPEHVLRFSAKYDITPNWSAGALVRAASSSYFLGDEVNAERKLAGFTVVNFNTQYRVSSNLELFGIVENAFNKEYAVAGVFLPTPAILGAIGMQSDGDVRSLLLAQPRSVYAGFRYKF
ncbi:hypothetical protein E6B08_20095 [Pseudomonas putida]|uniref:TonB-dependent receptor-like beta-barrel domain-containing protein n=1 Tax=Pseudomonas putida TaxID=303 RepID=A0A4D6XKY3_PSEPU|nr:TonB-dependent receptor [Pseudomonas putida]QCI13515.1 hypothetical protein E6B08_20095 [Pseudomonas putida]